MSEEVGLVGNRFTLVVVMFLILVPQSGARTDPQTGRIRLILIGAHWYGADVYIASLLRSDPRIDVRGSIETSNGMLPEEVRRRARLDFPRTRDRLRDGIDVLEYNFAPPWALSDEQQQWIHDAVVDEGLGLVLIHMGWRECLADPLLRCNRAEDWVNSILYPAFPMDIVLGEAIAPSMFMHAVEISPVVDLPEFDRQPFGPAGPSTYIGLVCAREGAKVHARWQVGKEDAIVSWLYGRGTVLALPASASALGEAMRQWKYLIDYVLNKVYFAADVAVPDDPELSHTLRAAFQQFHEQRSLVIDLIDFVDRFGANTAPLDRNVDDLRDRAAEASDLYVAGDYEGSLLLIRDATAGLLDLSAESSRVRRRALFWVYLTEWLTVSGTSILAGFLIWTVMIRRRYYREVGTTRHRRDEPRCE